VDFLVILRKSSKRLAILCEIFMWLNGYFTSSTVAVITRRCRRHPPHKRLCELSHKIAKKPQFDVNFHVK